MMTGFVILWFAALSVGQVAAEPTTAPSFQSCQERQTPPLSCSERYADEAYLILGGELDETQTRGNLDQAEVYARTSLEIVAGHSNDPSAKVLRARTLSVLGKVLARLGKLEGAEQARWQELEAFEALGDARLADIPLAYLGLASTLLAQDKWAEAEAVSRDGLRRAEAADYRDNPALESILQTSLKSNLAAALDGQRKYKEAEAIWFDLAAAIYEDLHSQGIDLSNPDQDLSSALSSVSDSEGARGKLYQAAILLMSLGEVVVAQGAFEDGIEFLNESARILGVLHPGGSRRRADTHSWLGIAHLKAGEVDKSIANSKIASAYYVQTLGQTHSAAFLEQAQLASVYLNRANRPDLAIAHFRVALEGVLHELATKRGREGADQSLQQRSWVFREFVQAAWLTSR